MRRLADLNYPQVKDLLSDCLTGVSRLNTLVFDLLSYLSRPSTLVAFCALGGIILALMGFRSGPRIAWFACSLFVICGLTPAGNVMLTPLEQRFPAFVYPDHIDGIVILGGSYDSQTRGYISTIVLEEATSPMNVVALLANRYPKAKIVFSGGDDPTATAAGVNESATAKQLFVSFGIAPSRILLENKSRTTVENARLSYDLLRPEPGSTWLLVTSAYHTPRAVGAYRKAGFEVRAFPVGWRTHGWREVFKPAISAADNLRRIDVAAHEWIGLGIYWLRGHTSNLFPGPE